MITSDINCSCTYHYLDHLRMLGNRVFGTQVTPPAPVLKTLPKIFAHADKNVRAEGTQLSHILYQYIGPAIEPWLAELKPVQVKELQEAFEVMEKDGRGKGTLKAERFTKDQQRELEAKAGSAEDGGAPGEEAAEGDKLYLAIRRSTDIVGLEIDLPDPRTLAEPVDIVPKLPSNMQTNLTSSKWKERKEVLDEILTVVNSNSRIQDAPELAELAKSLANCVQKDANINCVITAANVLEGLAKGIMTPFGRLREVIVPPMLERLKERKANVTDAIGASLDAVFSTVRKSLHSFIWLFMTTIVLDDPTGHHTRFASCVGKQKPASERRDLEVSDPLSFHVFHSCATWSDQDTC